MDDSTPRLSPAEAASLLHGQFGLAGELIPLPSERDQNFRLQVAAGWFVLKIAKSDERREVLELQNAAIAHLRGEIEELDWPVLRRTVRGTEIADTRDGRGRVHLARVFSWVEGMPLADASFTPRLEAARPARPGAGADRLLAAVLYAPGDASRAALGSQARR